VSICRDTKVSCKSDSAVKKRLSRLDEAALAQGGGDKAGKKWMWFKGF
jgi:hypothetical protein